MASSGMVMVPCHVTTHAFQILHRAVSAQRDAVLSIRVQEFSNYVVPMTVAQLSEMESIRAKGQVYCKMNLSYGQMLGVKKIGSEAFTSVSSLSADINSLSVVELAKVYEEIRLVIRRKLDEPLMATVEVVKQSPLCSSSESSSTSPYEREEDSAPMSWDEESVVMETDDRDFETQWGL